MKQKLLDGTGVKVSVLGFGAMPLSIQGRPGEAQGIDALHSLIDLGITLIDTADSYCLDENDKHHNERLIAKALATYKGDTSHIRVATKGGLMRPGGAWVVNGDPRHLQKTILDSYTALGGSSPIFLWQHHAPDPAFPLTESLEAVRKAVDAGLIEHVGVSNYTLDQITEAKLVLPIVSVQNQYNLWRRDVETNGVLDYCTQQELAFFPWGPLGGMNRAGSLSEVKLLAQMAREKAVTPQALVLAWLRHKSPAIIPIPGARTGGHMKELVEAAGLPLTDEEAEAIDHLRM